MDRAKSRGMLAAVDELLALQQAHLAVDDRRVDGPVALGAVLAEARDRQHHQLAG